MLRALLALLVACLSIPAVAAPACHAPVAAEASPGNGYGHGHHAPPAERDERAMPVHVCIGCIPPGHDLARIDAPASLPDAPLRLTRQVQALAGRALPPALPPPRA